MTQLTLNRIRSVLEQQFTGKIDMSDYAAKPQEEVRQAFLSRALAALCIKSLSGVEADVAGGAVTDGFHDGGIDAIRFEPRTDTLFLVQSKWSDTGNKPIDLEGTGKFVAGVRDLLSCRFDRFNERIKNKEAEIRTALYADRQIRIRLITIHSANQPTHAHVVRRVDDLVAELNDPVPAAIGEHLDQTGAYELITSESKPQKINLQIGLNQWGSVEKPFLAYYGYVHVGEIAEWWKKHANFLFTQNLRLFYHSSDVNEALKQTLVDEPEHFWYFNNGITVICDNVVRGLAGSPEHRVGVFTCNGVSIVNGAQTVGSIGNIIGGIPDGSSPPLPPAGSRLESFL